MDTGKFAICENGKIVNTIIADTEYAANVGAIALPDGFGVGDFFDGENFEKRPAPPPPEYPPIPPSVEELEQQITDIQLALCELYEGGAYSG